MLNLQKEKDNFKNHVAKFTDYGNIKILDFKDPKSSHYRIRFLFEEDFCRLHISGDFGELIATNYNNMTFEGFKDFINDVGYFEGKIDCMSRHIYIYDDEQARKDILHRIEEEDMTDDFMEGRCSFETIDDVIDDIMENFDDDRGISESGHDILSKHFYDAWEFIGDIGKRNTGILDLYMLAFKLATDQLEVED